MNGTDASGTSMVMGGFTLLRVAGLPIRHWLAGAGPGFFALLDRWERARTRYAALGGTLADQIGVELVPHPRLAAADRRSALSVRRNLHNGAFVSSRECRRLSDVVQSLDPRTSPVSGDGSLASRLIRAAEMSAEVEQLGAQAEEALAAERERLLALPWSLLNEHPVGRRMLADGTLPPAADIHRRLARGEPWTSKRMRRRSAYLWRMIARGTVKATPRTWLCQVAVAAVDDSGSPLLALPDLADRFAVERVENVAVPRRELALSGDLTEGTGVAIAPLRRLDGPDLRVWTVDPADVNRLRSITVRRTGPLTAIVEALGGGVRTVGEVTAAVLGAEASRRQHDNIRGFLSGLATMGVVEPSTPPRSLRTGWRPVTGAPATPAPASTPGGAAGATADGTRQQDRAQEQYVDVYRATAGTVSGAALQAVEDAVGQVQRIIELALADHPPGEPPFLRLLDTNPRPLLDVLGAELVGRDAEAGGAGPSHSAAGPFHPSTRWRTPRTPGSGYERLLAWMDAHASSAPGGPALRLTRAVLDRLGAPEVDLVWPMDCIVRPTASGHEAVLDMIRPAGMLDARFTQAIQALHGPQPHVAAYREFLRELDERTGVTSVELMVPPLWHVATNAVRRPPYTRAWTGDPDLAVFCEPSRDNPSRYLPPTELTIRRAGDSAVVAHHGRRIRLLYHSMRSALWPWNLLTHLLRGERAQQRLHQARLRVPLVAFPHRNFLPRLAINDALMLSPAQWRVSSARLWDPGTATELEKLSRLSRLRDEAGLPRWVAVYSRGHYGKPYLCDLESLAAVEVVERALAPDPFAGPDPGPFDVFIEEMLPAPGDVPVVDRAGRPGDRHAAEVMVRLPGRLSPAELAARAASARAGAPRPIPPAEVGPVSQRR